MGISRRWVCVLILLVSVCMLLCAGAQAGPAEDPAGREKLDYRLADRSEGTALMISETGQAVMIREKRNDAA